MTDQLILITSIWTLGLTIASQPNMLLSKLGEYAEGKTWCKPLISCYLCMPSVHSLIAYGFAIGMGIITKFSWSLVFMWPLVVCGASVLNAITWNLVMFLMKKNDYMDWQMAEDPNDETVLDDEPKEMYFKRN